eukprot:TRINITY_DN3587_c0_g1_i1.p1 TRINITY_DN3587_c0_g1~~TRINITY_DN3587_c0_g1_i1.p1  ORF type:complete len:681 (-),score=191.69 TRINITY_DN3587_c0_g1_i1:42-2084(-)
MDPREVEFTSLVGWLRTFALQSEATTAAELSDGLAMSEALVQIEPSVFTPSWFAGILKSDNTNNDTLNVILNLLLHFYRHNLGDVCISGELPVPEISPDCQQFSSEMIARFLKLMLGVAVTCSNKLLFISKIQSLDETTQHALTACVASFIYTKEWAGRVSAQSINSEPKMNTPPGDEIWAQKCHELDFQVALLKEERSNLINENEELYVKVKSAQTLSRKDSVKSRQFEAEIAHIKDEFERLRLAYEGTRKHVDIMESKFKPGVKEQGEVSKLTEETNMLKVELAKLKAGLSAKENGSKGRGEGALLQRLEEQQEVIVEMRSMIEYQAGLGREVECLKDQVDVLREQGHKFNRYEQELGDIKTRLQDFQMENDDMAEIVRQNQNLTLMSLGSETCLDSREDSMDMLNKSYSEQAASFVSQSNNMLEETIVMPIQVEQETELKSTKDQKNESDYIEALETSTGYSLMKEELRHVQTNSEVDSAPENHSELASHPESEPIITNHSKIEDDTQTSPTLLEMDESSYQSSSSPESEPTHEAVEQLLRVLSDPNLDIRIEDIEEALDTEKELSKSKENLIEANKEFAQASDLMEKPPDQLFDPNDPKVRELEEWNCSMDRSMIEEDTPRGKMKNVFKLKKMSKSRERNLLAEKFGPDDNLQEEEGITVDCFNSWMLQMFVKVFD